MYLLEPFRKVISTFVVRYRLSRNIQLNINLEPKIGLFSIKTSFGIENWENWDFSTKNSYKIEDWFIRPKKSFGIES